MIKSIFRAFLKIPVFIRFIGFYIKEVIKANLVVAHDILTPKHHMKPGVIAIPLDAKTDMELLSLNNLITMTPGTLSLDVSTDRKVIYIHAMYVEDPAKLRLQIKKGLESKIMELYR
ncbi:MAG TPA: Na+/H+ antiporter subunit E [bacterium]|nr:Na+/H+ antiporter subunit E [bacterium]HDP97903.1 Na+/H+ antiporter subunit E [bacterium]